MRRRILFICGWKWESEVKKKKTEREKIGNNSTNWSPSQHSNSNRLLLLHNTNTWTDGNIFSARAFYCLCTNAIHKHTHTHTIGRPDYESKHRRYPFCAMITSWQESKSHTVPFDQCAQRMTSTWRKRKRWRSMDGIQQPRAKDKCE